MGQKGSMAFEVGEKGKKGVFLLTKDFEFCFTDMVGDSLGGG